MRLNPTDSISVFSINWFFENHPEIAGCYLGYQECDEMDIEWQGNAQNEQENAQSVLYSRRVILAVTRLERQKNV